MPVYLRRAAFCLMIMIASVNAGADDEDYDPRGDLYDPFAPQNSPPTISGSPPTAAVAGQLYQFVPVASDVDGDPLAFAATNLPSWLNLDRASGALSGLPTSADLGQHGNIHLLVSDGQTSAWIGPFAISVVQGTSVGDGQVPTASPPAANGSVTLSWLPPTSREDGTPLLNLAGYRIYASRIAGAMTLQADLRNPGLTRHVLQSLATGDWWFSMTAYDATGLESDRSRAVMKTVR